LEYSRLGREQINFNIIFKKKSEITTLGGKNRNFEIKKMIFKSDSPINLSISEYLKIYSIYKNYLHLHLVAGDLIIG